MPHYPARTIPTLTETTLHFLPRFPSARCKESLTGFQGQGVAPVLKAVPRGFLSITSPNNRPATCAKSLFPLRVIRTGNTILPIFGLAKQSVLVCALRGTFKTLIL